MLGSFLGRVIPALGGVTVKLDDKIVVALFDTEAPRLIATVRLMLDSQEEAEEIVQEAFTRLLSSRKRLRQVDTAPAYLRSTAMNLARSALRKRGSARHNVAKVATDDVVRRAPEDIVIARQDDDAVASALATLPGRQRECLVLRYFLSLSEAEIAETLGISKGSVKTHTSRGLAGMQAVLGGKT